MEGLASFRSIPSFTLRPNRSSSAAGAAAPSRLSLPSFSVVRAQQVAMESESEPVKDELKLKEWEVGMFHNEVAAAQGIKIRRRPPTGPPKHYVGPFEFRLENEGNTPRNILEEIVWHKDQEVARWREKKPLHRLLKDLEKAPPVRDFVGAIRAAHERTGAPGLIAEVKKASPSRGVLREDFDPVEIAQAYESGGAACLSVLADEKYFQGSYENMVAIRSAGVQCPLLCKEFIVDAWQIYHARAKGADAILLIAAVLPDLDIGYMSKICKKLKMAVLVEVHDEREMDRVLGIEGIDFIGINNRNLETFQVDTSNTKKLLEGKRGEIIRERDIIVVGESGLFTPEDIAYVQEAGVKAVLVGESLVKQTDPKKGIAQLFEMGSATFDMGRHDVDFGCVPYVVTVENLEKGISPFTVMEFIHQKVSLLSQVMVAPSLSHEVYTRAFITVSSKRNQDKLSEFLENPNHIIVSTKTGRPWVLTDKWRSYDIPLTSIQSLMNNYQAMLQSRRTETSNELKVVLAGTEEYNTTMQRKNIVREIINYQVGLHQRFQPEEAKITQQYDAEEMPSKVG